MIYSWRTKKEKKGFKFDVLQITPRKTKNKAGQYADTKTVKTGHLPTRARARGQAKAWVKYYKNK